MLCGRAADRYAQCLVTIPPIELGYITRSTASQKCSDAQWGEPLHRGKSVDQAPDCAVIEMIVVVVRNKRDVDWRKLLELYCGRNETVGADERNRRGASGPHRIGQNVEAIALQEK